LSDLYKLPCSCGLFVPVETNQAGRSLSCSCGQQLQVPALSGILKLEPVPVREVRKIENAVPSKPASRSIRTKQVVTVIGTVATIVTCLLFIFGAWIRPIWTTSSIPDWISCYPQLPDVFGIQWRYKHDGKVIGRDTLPTSHRDFRLLIWSEEAINKHPAVVYNPLLLIEMHDNFKGGLELSYNFHEKYDKLVFHYWARFVVFAVLAIVSLIVLIVGIFLPRQVDDIGERGGESWE